MQLTQDFIVRKIRKSRVNEVDFTKLEFGKYVSDHMLVCDFYDGEWQTPQLVPFANLSLSPATLALHYGQSVFEGMKAFRMKDGSVNIFRMEKHYERLVKSLDRMCMQVPPKEVFAEGLTELVKLDNNWVPNEDGSSLYIRPFVFASEARYGVKVSDEYRFIIFSGPVGPYYAQPLRVKVEREFIRAGRGGTGYAKCAGNYGGAFYPTQLARANGFDQVLWTDARENKYIEESGTMNVMFVIDGKLVTPALSDSILDGVTRDSLIQLAKERGVEVEERRISTDELESSFRNNLITEAFGAGTAAVVAPINLIHIDGVDYKLPFYTVNSLMNQLKQQLEDIRTGRVADVHGWNCKI
ncbi:MAG: branched-chain amino acid aminotransferase [Sphingobacteriales bacterium]|nr:branched-chain amino acid aminotransferase [Sphingobacteriales bacterium]MBI3719115.1 branched-chain amino acid aminotransferase [Sphingobacteriales bacterium]